MREIPEFILSISTCLGDFVIVLGSQSEMPGLEVSFPPDWAVDRDCSVTIPAQTSNNTCAANGSLFNVPDGGSATKDGSMWSA